MTARDRLALWLEWRGWNQPLLARACECSQVKISQLLLGKQGLGLGLAHAIERLTSEPREDGTTWPEGPIRTEEWLAHDHVPTVAPAPVGGE